MTIDSDAFSELREISNLTRSPDQEEEGRERLIRFLDRSYDAGVTQIVDSLCARFGLYPYMSSAGASDPAQALAVEFHTPAPLSEEGFTFHSGQREIYNRLMDGENVILSAPTSFGKSAILDALVASERWANVVIIVPTVALIDETRRRLGRFRATYNILTHPTQEPAARNIWVMTQERFVEARIDDVDFFVIDEFYKLGQTGAVDSRQALLNIAWNRLKATGAQYYMIGPNIDSLRDDLDPEIRNNLTTMQFKTVVVDILDRSEVDDPESDLIQLVSHELEGSTLVFTGSPAKADRLALSLGENVQAEVTGDGMASAVASWLGESYDDAWAPVMALSNGVGVHTGPLPRSVQRIMVRLFNESMIPVLVCTSTLIEGVNTAAKNVVIYDRKIDGQLLDFFTFSNIRGRAGRMFRHFVGRVITYAPPPETDQTEVDIPIESQSESASLATLIQLDESAMSEYAKERLSGVLEQTVLSLETLRANRGLSPERQLDTAERVRTMPRSERDLLVWSGRPTNEQARATLRLGFEYLLEPRQRRGINFEMLWGQLQANRVNAGDFSALVDSQQRYARVGQSRGEVVSDVLRFQRNWMGFTIPSMLRGLHNIQSEVLPDLGMRVGNYEFLLREVEALYLPPGLAELDEYGVPLPLAQKLTSLGLRGATVADLLEDLLRLRADPRTMTRLSAVEQWILQDVVSGLGYE